MQAIKEIEFQYVTNQAWEKTAVLLPIAEFEEILEDFSDLALIAERRDEKTVTQEELSEELKRDGILKNPMEAFRHQRIKAVSQRFNPKNSRSSRKISLRSLSIQN